MRIHTATVVQAGGGGGGGWMEPLPEVLICCSISKRFYLRWKAFDPQDEACYMGGGAAGDL